MGVIASYTSVNTSEQPLTTFVVYHDFPTNYAYCMSYLHVLWPTYYGQQGHLVEDTSRTPCVDLSTIMSARTQKTGTCCLWPVFGMAGPGQFYAIILVLLTVRSCKTVQQQGDHTAWWYLSALILLRKGQVTSYITTMTGDGTHDRNRRTC